MSDTTNFRLEVCELHAKPEISYCFTCGAPLREEILDGERTLTCSKLWVHLRIWVKPHEGDPDGECDAIKVI